MKRRFTENKRCFARSGICMLVVSCVLATFHAYFRTTDSTAYADDFSIYGQSIQSEILSVEDATLLNYSSEDLIAMQSFLLNRYYEGNGRVIDLNNDNRIDVFDLCIMRRDYKETGNYYDLLAKMIEANNDEYSVTLSSGESYSNRIIARADQEYDFSEYNAVNILYDSEYRYVLQFDSQEKTEFCLNDLQNKDHILYAELDGYVPVPDDDAYDENISMMAASNSWGVSVIEADKYASYLSSNYNNHITVAVVDSGVANHSFLNSRVLSEGYDIINRDNDPSDDSIGHGTHVAGTIVDCTPGLNIDILPVKVFNGRTADASIITAGIKYAREMGADVINLSLGGGISADQEYEINKAINAGITVVCSAGNDGADTKNYSPARLSNCIVVSAIDSEYRTSFPYHQPPFSSNYGSSVDVCAPGVYIKSSVPGGGYGLKSGTSMAAPHIAAAAAMIKYSGIATSPSKIESTLIGTCQDLGAIGFDVYYGNGLPKLSKLINSNISPWINLSTNATTLYTGEKFTLSASVNPGDVDIKWTTSNASVASVSNGTVTAHSEGSATITAFFTYNGKNYSATCKVTVKKPGISISETSKSVYQTNQFTLTATTNPGGQSVSWSTSNSSVATVSGGKVTAVNPGTATITASFVYGGVNYSASCTVTVKEVSIKLSETSKTVYQTDTFSLTATTVPSGQTISWKSSDSSVATVSGGKITAVNPGTATITASFVYGGKTFSASCTVTVKKVSVELSKKNLEIILGDSANITANTSPNGLSVSWQSSNVVIASVLSGKVTAKAPGNVTITATITYNGVEFSDTCSVVSSEPYVNLSYSQLKLTKNDTVSIVASTYPSNQKITWTSADSSICSVDSNGKLTAKGTGNTTITATMTYAGNSYYKTCTVIVGTPTVKLSDDTMKVYVGGSDYLVASVIAVDGSSTNATTDVTWSSSNSNIVTVNSGGKVTGIKAGSAVITAKYYFAGEYYSATCNVTVQERPNITLNKSSLSLYIGDTSTLSATVTPSGQNVSWSSSKTSVATVSSTGKITAVSNGTATITASFRYDGVTYSETCTVTVVKPTITLSSSSGTIIQGNSITISATTKPGGYSVSWSTSNSSVASVSGGKITGKAAGTATITAKFTYAGNTYSATYTITVQALSLTLSSYSGSGTKNVWDGTYLTDGSACGYLVSLPKATYTSGCSVSWSVISGSGKIVNNPSELFIMQPGTVKVRCTVSNNGYSVYKDYSYTLSLFKTTTAVNYFYKQNPYTYNTNNYRYDFNVPANKTVYITEIVLNGKAGVSGSTLYGKTTYNGYTGWIIISAW